MNLAKAFATGAHPSTLGMLQSWESEEGVHTPSGSKTPVVMCGWLLKMKREHRKFESAWNRRWFTVEDGALNWYKTSSSDTGGRLSLVNMTNVRKFEGGGSYTFIVQGTDRDMLLRAESANDIRRWMRGLTLQIDLIHGGTFQGPPSAKNRRRTVFRAAAESGAVGYATPRQQLQSREEQHHFREINDRIKAIMGKRTNDDSARTGNISPVTQGSGASATASPFRPGCSAPLPGATPGRSRSEAPIALSVVQTAEVTPRSGRRNAGGGSAKVVPVSTTPWRSSSQPNRNATNADVDVDVVDVNGDQDDGCDRARRRASYGRSESARGGGVGGGGGGRMVSRPPEPKGPPPSNGGGRRSSAPSLRLTRGEARRKVDKSAGRNQGAIVDIEDLRSEDEADVDTSRRSQTSAGNFAVGVTVAERRKVGKEGGEGGEGWGTSPQKRGRRGKKQRGFQDLDGISSEQSSTRTREDLFMDEFSAGERFRGSQDERSESPPQSADINKKRCSSPRDTTTTTNEANNTTTTTIKHNTIDAHKPALTLTKSKSGDHRARKSRRGQLRDRGGCSSDRDNVHCDPTTDVATLSRAKNQASSPSETAAQSANPTTLATKKAGAAVATKTARQTSGWGPSKEGGGAGTQQQSRVPEARDGGEGSVRTQRGNSSESMTAKESWCGAFGPGAESDTSSSRFGSGRLSSSRSESRQASSRRYLTEQNRFKEGW